MNIQDFFMQNNRMYGNSPSQILYDYDGGSPSNLVYVGFAARGVATSAAYWWIVKISYNADNTPASETTAPVNSIWDNRASLTYA